MGFFSDIIKMAASEVANAVMDGVNEAVAIQEEQAMYLEELEEKYKNIDYCTLTELLNEEELDIDDISIIKKVLNERDAFVKQICSSPSEETFCEFDDEELVAYYDRLILSRGSAFSDKDAKTLTRLFQKELMSRPIAKRLYAESKEDYFSEFDYEEIETIVMGNSVFYDEILKYEAEKELSDRNEIIKCAEPDVIDELDNDEFMGIYALVRADGSKLEYSYFGKYRDKMLSACEKELITNRKYLITKFISAYCEEELEMYANYSDKKLKLIIASVDNNSDTEDLTTDDVQYDLCDKLIAKIILDERGGE